MTGAVSLSLLVSLGILPATEANAGGLGRPDLPAQRVSEVKKVGGPGAAKARKKAAEDRKANAGQAKRASAERAAAWPKAGEAIVALDTKAKDGGAASPGGMPVTMKARSAAGARAGAEAKVTVLDQKAADKAGITGVLLTAAADTSGSAELSLDYSGFASAIGGGWAGRLRLVKLPACALTTPEKDACRRQTPLKSDNDLTHQTVSSRLAFAEKKTTVRAGSAAAGGTVLALTAAPAGGGAASGAGDYSATDLSAASSWQAGNSAGSFTWKQDFPLPPAAGDPTPTLSLSYDSGSTDGRTSNTNNQGTPVGEGFGLTDSYIERSYESCDDAGHDEVFDRCWKYDNARLVLNGKSSQLVKTEQSGVWRLKNDDASRVTRSTGADNGDDNGEYWTVVTGNGTKYVFGLNKLDGATDQRTNSTWTVPVFGDDPDDPGYTKGDAFADRAVTQAWRWNLDLVVSAQGNAAAYWYAKETNHYKKNKAETANASYTRGGYLKEIDYGLRKDALFTDDADAKVTFDHAERCTASDCSELTKETAHNWPDVPYDAMCSDGDKECDAAGPSFFTRKRLTGIDTFSWSAADKMYQPVDSWQFKQKFLDGGDIGDSTDQTLTLESVTRTAKAGTPITEHSISFTYQMRPNRVDATDDILPLTRPRISTVTSETGALTTVTLSQPECRRSEVIDAAEDTNTRPCYPQYWNINGAEKASVDWFHKYRVLAVVTSDPAGHNEAVENAYEYAGAAWHHEDDPFVPKDERTWSDWRGYRQVTVHTGALNATRSKTVSLYMQGMDGDKTKGGTPRDVSVSPLGGPDLGIPAVADSDQYAGQLRERVVYAGTEAVTVTRNDLWSKETARQSVPDATDDAARYVRSARTTTYTYLAAAKSWRSRTVANTYDDYGMTVAVDDSGEVGKGGDETCTRTWYARNDDAGISTPVSRVRAVGKSCSVADTDLSLPSSSASRGDVLSDTATVYDDPKATEWTPGQKPTRGEATWTGRATGYVATAGAAGDRLPTGWQTVGTTEYDTLGRPVSEADAAGKTTTTAYTPADSGPLTQVARSNAKQHKTTTVIDPRRGLELRTYDPNTKKTELAYDALGRLTSVWLPNRNKAAGQSASSTFAYQLNATTPSWVSTSTLKSDGKTYNTRYELYDALLRPLQTQSPTPQGGRILTDTRYDSRGLVYETYADIFDNTSSPTGTYTRAEYGESPTQTAIVTDGAGRETRRTVFFFGKERWSTTTKYTGDSTATTALKGGSAQRTIVDARGRTVETREYAGSSPADKQFGDADGTAYSSVTTRYGLDGQETGITGPDGAKWSYGYDLFGRRTSVDDPDKGTASTAYNALDQVIRTTDARGKSILTEYDEIGRITGTWAGEKTDDKRLTAHTYDTVTKGKPTASTRYVGGTGGKAYTRAVTVYDSIDRAVETELRLPEDDPLVKAGASATLKFSSYYNINGTLKNTTEPALGGLPSETIERDYTGLGQVKSISGTTGYLLDTDYSALGQPQQLVLGNANTEDHKKTYITQTYEQGTGRLTDSRVTDQTHPYTLQDLHYTLDETGNVTSVADSATLGGTGKAETQCFAYDGHRRLTDAWTPALQECSDAPNADNLTGPAPYWDSYTYNDAGQRTTETKHTAGGDAKTTYCYSGSQKHTLTGTSVKGDCGAPDKSYGYDEAGNTTERPGKDGAQELGWSEEGKLAKITEGSASTGYVYDADGNLLIRSDTDGERVLYAGSTELHLKKDGKTWAQRYYGTEELTVALRTNQSGSNKLYYLAGDHHGTSSLAVAADTQTIVKRYSTVFGAVRTKGAIGDWVDDRGFLGKTHDAETGLTHIGAREYDAELGRFLSVDPLLEVGKHQSLNGYGYAENNPVTLSDPTGEGSFSCRGSQCGIDVIISEMVVSPPLFSSGAGGGGGGGFSWLGSSPTTSNGWTGTPSLPLPKPPPLLKGPDPLTVLYSDPETRDLVKMLLDMQAVNRKPSGTLASGDFGGDGKVKVGGPWTLAFRWLWGSSEGKTTTPNLSFDGDDELTQSLIKSTSMADARAKVATQFAESGTKRGEADYSVSKNTDGEDLNVLQQVGVYVSDFGGLAVGKEDRKAQGVLGSYDVDYNVTRSKGSTLVVEYHAWTDIDNESFLPTHAKWQKAANIAPRYMGGYTAGFRVDVRWHETIYK